MSSKNYQSIRQLSGGTDYTEICPRLYLGNDYSFYHKRFDGSAIVNLTQKPITKDKTHSSLYLFVPPATHSNNIGVFLKPIHTFITEKLNKGCNVLVFCEDGNDRAACALVYHLYITQQLTPSNPLQSYSVTDVIKFIQEKRPSVHISSDNLQQLAGAFKIANVEAN